MVRRWSILTAAILTALTLTAATPTASAATAPATPAGTQVAASFIPEADITQARQAETHKQTVKQAGGTALATAAWRVISGDTLWALARRFCGAGGLYPRLAAANRIANPDRIYVGQRLRITCTRTATPRASRSGTAPTVSGSRTERVIRFALAQVGKPYRWAADGPGSYDCSGLVMASFARIGVHLPHQSGAMLRYGKHVSRSQLRRGDIVWPQWGHVAIYLGHGRIVHASNRRDGVRVSALYGFLAARRM